MNTEILAAHGIDYEAGVARFRGNEALYEKLLSMVLKDTTFPRMREAYDAQDDAELFEGAHELKGVSGNAALNKLYEADCRLVEYLRTGAGDRQKTDALFSAVEAAYDNAVEGIRLALGL